MSNSETLLSNSICAEGIFDSALNFLHGNSLISGMVGNCNNVCIYMLVPEDEKKILEELVEACKKEPGKEFEEGIHFADNTEGIYHLYLIKMRRCDTSENLDVKLIPFSGREAQLQEMALRLNIARDYLTFSGNFLLRYYPENNQFRMFWVNQEENIVIYEMDLDEWYSFVLEKGYLDGEYHTLLRHFCKCLKGEEKGEEFIFKSKIVTKGESLTSDHIRIKRKIYNGQENIIGTWCIADAESGADLNHFVEDSYIDQLTGLLNKKSITDYARRAVEEAGNRNIAIAVMDIDNFKSVNDTYGHMFGDKVIIAAAQTIKNSIGKNAVAGRMGGDEFMVVFQDFEDETDLRNRLRCTKMNIGQVYKEEMKEVTISGSIGASRYPRDSRDYDELFKIADKCLYIAKQKGKNRYIIFEPEKHGQFMGNGDNNDMMDIKEAFYSEADMVQIRHMLSDIIIDGNSAILPLFERVGQIMNLDRISVSWKNRTIACFANDFAKDKPELDLAVLKNERYIGQFHNDLLSANNVSRMEYTIPEAYDSIKQAGIFTMLQYILRDREGNIQGALTAEGCQKVFSIPEVTNQTITNMGLVLNSVLLREDMI